MDSSNLIKILIRDNIKNRLREDYELTDEEELDKMIDSKLINIENILNFDEDIYGYDQCCARVWRKSVMVDDKIYNFKKVDSRCNFKGTEDLDGYKYCKKHSKQLKDNGYLRLLRYDEECPKRDITGHKDGEYVYGKKRIWYKNFKEQLEILLRYHNNELERLAWGGR